MSAASSESLFQRRWKKFKTLRRGYYSFWILIFLYLLSWVFPYLIHSEALVVYHNGEFDFPRTQFYPGTRYGLESKSSPNWRELKESFKKEGGESFVVMPPYPYGPYEQLLEIEGAPPHDPSWQHWCGTDSSGRDVFARLCWGFRVSISFALLVVSLNYLVGITIGAMLGYYGGKFDIIVQRFIEVLAAMPFLYFVMIMSSILRPDNELKAFFILVLILCIFGWMGLTYYVRGEFYREKAKDYVAAAISQGESDFSLIFKHILPNALTPVITFAPFAIVGAISSLVSLDFLGFGLPVPTPSWGELVSQGVNYLTLGKWWLIVFPLGAMFFSLMLVVFIGEAIREAFDPKVFSRLR